MIKKNRKRLQKSRKKLAKLIPIEKLMEDKQHQSRNRRYSKDYAFRKSSNWPVGQYIISCSNKPGVIRKAVPESWDYWSGKSYIYDIHIEWYDLVDGHTGFCSNAHCGLEHITRDLALEMAKCIKEEGHLSYLRKYRKYTEEDIEHFLELNKKWDFTPENEL